MTEQAHLNWPGMINYLYAKSEARHVEVYAMDLLWSIARRNYRTEIPMPSELMNRKPVDRRTAAQIIQDTIDGIGGE